MPTAWIPPPMRELTDGRVQVEVRGQTVRQLIDRLDQEYPGIGERLCEGDRLRSGVAVSIDGVISPEGLRARLEPGSEVHFLPAIAGGNRRRT